jgi:ubiquinone/menaquinone biosynthesis C-methylase UbiE
MPGRPKLQTVYHPRWKGPIRTVEHRWDLLYSDFPDVYHEFATTPGTPMKLVHEVFDLAGKVVLDAGSGTGSSSLQVAGVAQQVIGLEVERATVAVARREIRKRRVRNVSYVQGDARAMPIRDDSVDVVMGLCLSIYPPEGWRKFIREATRVVRDRGLVVVFSVPPGWYGGELGRILQHETELARVDRIFRKEFGFKIKDVYHTSNYGSVGKMLETYGFIFGRRAIEYILDHQATSVRWKNRYLYKFIRKTHGPRRRPERIAGA